MKVMIYLISNKINGKLYIGQTIQKIEVRFKRHLRDAINLDRSYAIHLAIRKYGTHNFAVSVLDICSSIEEANDKEKYFINHFNSLSPNGYNLRAGGNNSLHSDKTKEKISSSHRGKRLSEDHRKNIGLGGKGRPGFWKNKTLSQQAKNKMSLVRIGRVGTNNRRAICVETGQIFGSLTEASIIFNTTPSKISRVCTGKRKSTRGHSFRYGDDHVNIKK